MSVNTVLNEVTIMFSLVIGVFILIGIILTIIGGIKKIKGLLIIGIIITIFFGLGLAFMLLIMSILNGSANDTFSEIAQRSVDIATNEANNIVN